MTWKSHFSFLISLTKKHASGQSSWNSIGEFSHRFQLETAILFEKNQFDAYDHLGTH